MRGVVIHPVRAAAVLSVAVWLTACGSDAPNAPLAPNTPVTQPPPPPAPTVVGIAVMPDSAGMRLGEELILQTVMVTSNGSRITVPGISSTSTGLPPSYSAYPYGILSIGANGRVIAVGAGTANVIVHYERMVAHGRITVAGPVATNAVGLKIESFTMWEYQWEGTWYYAPQLDVSAEGPQAITVLTVTFQIPGLPSPFPSWDCGARVPGGSSRALNGEVYGSWSFELLSPGNRANGEDATATVWFLDGSGAIGSKRVTGRVAAGWIPDTYSGGQSGGACFHGYGSPG